MKDQPDLIPDKDGNIILPHQPYWTVLLYFFLIEELTEDINEVFLIEELTEDIYVQTLTLDYLYFIYFVKA